jgi:DNA polymerase-3 subunit delta'
LGVANKKCIINVRDSAVIINALSYRPYEAAMRVVIIHMAEHMNEQTANKLLKSLEEPPNGTMFILTAESIDHMLPTILSRVQAVRLARPTDAEVETALVQRAQSQPAVARRIAHLATGNVRVAMDLAQDPSLFEDPTRFFISWMRAAYAMNVEEMATLGDEFAKWGRETQRVFLSQALSTLRKVLLQPTGTLPPDAVLPDEEEFLRKFAPFINAGTAGRIASEMDRAAYHIERNGAGRIIFTDLTLSIADALREAALQRA